ncbi:DUF4974 domain-containing protein [Marinilabiliaceae bacterium JC017]|nr:DUF4974 domain-containing protein [Marinilabiliaceae bacterium JC017]
MNRNQNSKITKLFVKLFEQSISSEELKVLNDWAGSNAFRQHLLHKMRKPTAFEEWHKEVIAVRTEESWKVVEKAIKANRGRQIRMEVMRYAAIAIMTLMVGAAIYYFSAKEPVAVQPQMAKNVIEPGSSKARLFLDDGQVINLEEKQAADYLEKDSSKISVASGEVTYLASRDTREELIYNTIQIPRGGTYTLVLADGTRVYMNSETELKYPVRFSTGQRKVTLKGEAYFEVTKDPEAPFIVEANNSQVEVLGTAFNVKAYADESVITTTLVEGSVKFSNTQETLILEPSDQTVFNTLSNKVTTNKVNTDLYTAWKDGYFWFKNESLEDVLTRMSRWYDFDVFYKNQAVKELRFSGKVEVFEDVDILIRMIEKTTDIQFEISGRAVIVQ